ncbi:MAG: hypothetical protein KME07_08785 [Pegethrix bostrychoides GSE-TBD4-15B]|jgi:hypothetical protein|uniref:Uncharacterized protein n=1 Tax=Pegethrix bostrychoides GSE-TBD4-15B TaxID=2839662 RepID=A0A951PA21_9CYAN|nr:hypothetical protein [Pegethrix bostrychoides GSE-TBD4-15B]
MQDYFEESEFILEQVQFKYSGKRYKARGVMSWNPEAGFHVEAPLDLQSLPDAEEVGFGRFKIISKKDTTSIKLFLSDGRRAIAPSIPLIDRYDVISENRLSINFSRAIFLTKYPYSPAGLFHSNCETDMVVRPSLKP